ncbi:putative Zn-dependent protease [Desulfobotulus alkaliphilus]|uniref:Putative Zn-dependent protease n=2 Tax=Desulfobotulus alkaliphilus TaxID=622671 RepID=A0A562RVR4_9BACT|nr:putative Zn-dependent protease [Desulfobotulus alkaliphilus]
MLTTEGPHAMKERRFMSLLQQAVNRVFLLSSLVIFSMIPPPPAFSLTLQQEEVLAEEFVRYIHATHRLVRDPLITGYVREVGGRIVDVLEDPPFPITFNVVLNPSYNAFAGPGGHIYIHSGLILAMESEEELAGILGHEIAHVTCRHISEIVARSKKVGIGTLAGLAAGILAAVGGASPDAAFGLIMGSQAAGQSALLSYSRENEREADERGLGYLSAAGYGGEGLLTMLRKIRGKEWYTTDDVPTYLRTHPGTEERITFVSAWLKSRQKDSPIESRKNPSDDEAFARVRDRLQARYTDSGAAVSHLGNRLKEDPDNLSVRHALALAQIRNGDRDDALKNMEIVTRANPMDKVVISDLGRIRFHAGQPEAAILLLKNVAPETGDPEVFFDLGRAYAALGHYEEAVKTYEEVLRMAPDLIGARYALGEVLGRMGRDGLAHYHLGRYHHGTRNFSNADFHYARSISLLAEDSPESRDARERREAIARQLRKASPERR